MMAMPNQPKTPHSSFRIPPTMKTRLKAEATATGKSQTEIVMAGLEMYFAAQGETK